MAGSQDAGSKALTCASSVQGSTGATNVLRQVGKGPALVVFLIDVGKGAAAVLIARALGQGDWIQVLAGLTALAGHIWPVWLGFKGGKAVATGLGLFLGLAWPVGLASFGVFLADSLALPHVSLSSVLAASQPAPVDDPPSSGIVPTSVIALVAMRLSALATPQQPFQDPRRQRAQSRPKGLIRSWLTRGVQQDPWITALRQRSCAQTQHLDLQLGDRPADHQLAGTGRDRLCRPHHPSLITHRNAFRANTRRHQCKWLGVLSSQRRGLQRRTHTAANAGSSPRAEPTPSTRSAMPWLDGKFPLQPLLLPAGEHRDRQQALEWPARTLCPLHRRGLRRLQRFAAGAGMHGDQFGSQRCCPPARPGHRGRDVVKFEIKKHPQALVPQLRHHLRPRLDK